MADEQHVYKLTQSDYNLLMQQMQSIQTILSRAVVVADADKNAVGKTVLPQMLPDKDVRAAMKKLTYDQIENLLDEKIENMLIYSHYDLARLKQGWNKDAYNNVTLDKDCVAFNTGACRNMKIGLEKEEWFKPNILVINALKTCDMPYGMTFCKEGTRIKYNKGDRAAVNIVFYNPVTKRFASHPRGWFCLGEITPPFLLYSYGAATFAHNVLYDFKTRFMFSRGFDNIR